jgi:hypothetical protein
MLIQDVENVLRREPFNPLRVHKSDGKVVEIPFSHVAIVLRSQGLLVFKGVKKAGSHVAKSYEVIPYDRIDRIEERRGRASGRRKKAS